MKNKINQPIKYDFSSLHNEQAAILTSLILNNVAAHAWLITGVWGSGKIDFIYKILKEVFTYQVNDSQKVKSIISQIDNGSYSNLMLIKKSEDKKKIAVEEIRKIHKFLNLSASDNNFKIVVIDNVDDMNFASANALLKILEEPPSGCFLFLLNHVEAKLHKTIKSRCNIIRLKIPKVETSIISLQRSNIDSKLFENLFYLSGNSPGIVLKLAKYQIFLYYEQLLSLIKEDLNFDKIIKLIEEISSQVKDDTNLLISIMFNNILLNIVKTLTKIDYNQIIEGEKTIITAIAVRKKIDQWFDIYNQQRIMLIEQVKTNLDLKQTFLLAINMIQE